MLTAFSHYNLNGFPDTENETPSPDSAGLALSLDLLRRSMADFDCGARLSLPEGGSFEDLISPGAGFLSLGHTFTLSNPDTAGKRLRAESDDFKYLCRLFGVRFSEAEAFRIRNAMTFIPDSGPGGNVLSYQMAEINMEMRYQPGVTSFFELVKNKGGNNYVLFWEALPDVFGQSRTGEARGCTILCEALALKRLVSDDTRAAAELPLVLPTVERVGAMIGRLYRGIG